MANLNYPHRDNSAKSTAWRIGKMTQVIERPTSYLPAIMYTSLNPETTERLKGSLGRCTQWEAQIYTASGAMFE